MSTSTTSAPTQFPSFQPTTGKPPTIITTTVVEQNVVLSTATIMQLILVGAAMAICVLIILGVYFYFRRSRKIELNKIMAEIDAIEDKRKIKAEKYDAIMTARTGKSDYPSPRSAKVDPEWGYNNPMKNSSDGEPQSQRSDFTFDDVYDGFNKNPGDITSRSNSPDIGLVYGHGRQLYRYDDEYDPNEVPNSARSNEGLMKRNYINKDPAGFKSPRTISTNSDSNRIVPTLVNESLVVSSKKSRSTRSALKPPLVPTKIPPLPPSDKNMTYDSPGTVSTTTVSSTNSDITSDEFMKVEFDSTNRKSATRLSAVSIPKLHF